ncbi:MAG: DUF4179 domain-containing protein [Clostridiales bacterium]|nr:DUF4179 domain-containing protein [Clostridiales bacterium]
MNEKDFSRKFRQITPEVPQDFHQAMKSTLSNIVRDEHNNRGEIKVGRRFSGRTLALALMIMLLLTTVAMALMNWTVFENIIGAVPQNASKIMKSNLATVTVNNVEITIKEAGYDGMSLYLQYSHRMLDMDHPVGEVGEGDGKRYLTQEDMQEYSDYKVGWWIDNIWFDGKPMDMPAGSSGTTNGTEVNGEIIESQLWRLSVEDVYLDGKVEISLPIGERQDRRAIYATKNEDGTLPLPEDGMVTFTLDTTLAQGDMIKTHPNIPTEFDTLTATVSEVVYTPIMAYINVDVDVKDEALADFIARNGDGFYGEEGELFWKYGPADVLDEWGVYSLVMVDGDGNLVLPNMREEYGYIYGGSGYSTTSLEYLFPYLDQYPEEMYLVQSHEGVLDLDHKIKVK